MLHLKSDADIEKIRAAGRVAAALLRVQEELKAGITTDELNAVADRYIRSQGGRASALATAVILKSICISVNDEIVHGIPGPRVLNEGDILAIDIAVKKDGFHGDMNASMTVGNRSRRGSPFSRDNATLLRAGLGARNARIPARRYRSRHPIACRG